MTKALLSPSQLPSTDALMEPLEKNQLQWREWYSGPLSGIKSRNAIGRLIVASPLAVGFDDLSIHRSCHICSQTLFDTRRVGRRLRRGHRRGHELWALSFGWRCGAC